MNARILRLRLIAALALALPSSAAAAEAKKESPSPSPPTRPAVAPARAGLPPAEEVLEATGVSAGLAVVVGTTDGVLEAELAKRGKLLVQGLARTDEATAAARQHIRALGCYGPASVDRWTGNRLPYADNLVNLLVTENLGATSMEEVLRVLAPLGVAYVKTKDGWSATVKPWPTQIDQWTHFRHDAGGTNMARDARVGPARHVQWWDGPMFCRSHELTSSVSTIVSARGRLFYVLDEGLVTLGEKWHKDLKPVYRLVARDAFNGILLWKKPIPDWGLSSGGGRMGWTAFTYHRLVADGDRVYVTLGMKAPVSALDAATGETVRTYTGTDEAKEILAVAGTLICRTPEQILAVEAATGRRLWSHPSKSPGLRRIVAGAAGVAFCDAGRVSFAELATGRLRWNQPLPTVSRLTLCDQWLLCETTEGVSTLAVTDGRLAWTKEGKTAGNTFFYGDGTLWMHQYRQVVGLDPATGRERTTVPGGGGRGHHPRCYPPKATTKYVLNTKRGLEYLDLARQGETPCDWTRGACGVGILPCNGLTYVPPNQCACYQGVKLNGFWAYAAETASGAETPAAERLRRGPAYGDVRAAAVASDDWPAYRRDARLSASTPARVPAAWKKLWQVSVGGRLSSPVAAYGLVAVAAVDEHTVIALDAKTGAEHWRFVAGGRIDSPPTFFAGLLLFGSADGWVYCLRATDGRLVWQYQMAPAERRVCSWGRIESAWPVHGAVLVLQDVAYAVAGRSTYLDGGIRVCAFEPATGRLLHETTLRGPAPDKAPPPNGFWMEGAFSDLLVSDGQRLYLSQIVLDKSLRQLEAELINRGGDKRMGLRLSATQGLLTDPWYSRGFWMYARRWPGYRRRFEEAPKSGTLLCFNDKIVCALKAFDIGGHSPYFYPARQGYLLFADDVNTEPQLWGEEGSAEPLAWLPRDSKGAARLPVRSDPDRITASGGDVPYTRSRPPLWTTRVPVRVHAMALAADTLLIAGPPDVVDANDPLGSFEGRLGGKLWAVSAADGKQISASDLSSPPVFDGMAAANGRLYLSLMDGTLVCQAEQ